MYCAGKVLTVDTHHQLVRRMELMTLSPSRFFCVHVANVSEFATRIFLSQQHSFFCVRRGRALKDMSMYSQCLSVWTSSTVTS